MQNRSKSRLGLFLAAAALLAVHFATDIFNIGVKDGKATAHSHVQSKGR